MKKLPTPAELLKNKHKNIVVKEGDKVFIHGSKIFGIVESSHDKNFGWKKKLLGKDHFRVNTGTESMYVPIDKINVVVDEPTKVIEGKSFARGGEITFSKLKELKGVASDEKEFFDLVKKEAKVEVFSHGDNMDLSQFWNTGKINENTVLDVMKFAHGGEITEDELAELKEKSKSKEEWLELIEKKAKVSALTYNEMEELTDFWELGYLSESRHINENVKSELSDFLDENGIYGYTNTIYQIINGDTVPDAALTDIKDYLTDNNINKNIKEDDIVKKYKIPQLLSAYLGWNGIYGYTEDILDIAGIDYSRVDLFEDSANNITPETDMQKLYKIHQEDNTKVVYYDDGSDSWLEVPADSGKWGTNWKFGVKNVNESAKYDMEAVIKDIKEFNRNNITSDELANRVVANLRLPKGSEHIVKDHFGASANGNGKLPEDTEMVKELYGMVTESRKTIKGKLPLLESSDKAKEVSWENGKKESLILKTLRGKVDINDLGDNLFWGDMYIEFVDGDTYITDANSDAVYQLTDKDFDMLDKTGKVELQLYSTYKDFARKNNLNEDELMKIDVTLTSKGSFFDKLKELIDIIKKDDDLYNKIHTELGTGDDLMTKDGFQVAGADLIDHLK